MYLKNNLTYKVRQDLSVFNAETFESVFVEVERLTDKNIIIGVLYRPPNQNTDECFQTNEAILSKITKENELTYIMGDFNFDLLKYKNHLSNEFLEQMYSNSLYPLITNKTHMSFRNIYRQYLYKSHSRVNCQWSFCYRNIRSPANICIVS